MVNSETLYKIRSIALQNGATYQSLNLHLSKFCGITRIRIWKDVGELFGLKCGFGAEVGNKHENFIQFTE